jgi:hypothetical protein
MSVQRVPNSHSQFEPIWLRQAGYSQTNKLSNWFAARSILNNNNKRENISSSITSSCQNEYQTHLIAEQSNNCKSHQY